MMNYYLPFIFGKPPRREEIVMDDVHITTYDLAMFWPLPPGDKRIILIDSDFNEPCRTYGHNIICYISFGVCLRELKSKLTEMR
jgi:hypothetical protein